MSPISITNEYCFPTPIIAIATEIWKCLANREATRVLTTESLSRQTRETWWSSSFFTGILKNWKARLVESKQ